MRAKGYVPALWMSIISALAIGCEDGSYMSGPDVGTGTHDGGAGLDTGNDGDLARTEVGTCPDGGTAEWADAKPGQLVATRANSSAIRIDGRLDERSNPELEYVDETGESDNEARVFARWNSTSLYVGVAVRDDQVEAAADAGPWKNDSFELALDPDADGGQQLEGDESKWLVDVDESLRSGRAEGGNWVRTSEQAAEAAVRTTADGYTVELRIPWGALDGVPGPDSRTAPNVILVMNDRDDGEVRRFSWTGPIDDLQTPGAWGTLRLPSDPCGEVGPSGDTGVEDAGDAGDGSEPRLGPPRYVSESDFNFTEKRHAVRDLGMDPNGNTPIDDKLEQARKSNRLIVFPPGKYKIKAGRDRNPTHYWKDGVEHFGIKGLGEEPKDVQFVVEQQPAGYGGRWLNQRGGEGLMLKNFAIQMNWDDEYTSADMAIRISDLLLVEKVEWAGLMPHDDHTNGMLFHVHVTDTDGVGELNRVYIREGAVMPQYPNGSGGIRMGPGHKGTLYATDLWLENTNSSAIRFSKAEGRVGLEGGFFKNNANTNLRGGAGDHPDGPSYMRGATVVLDTENYNEYQPSDEPLTTTHGLRVDSTGKEYSGLIVEDVDFYFLNPPPNSEVINRPGFGDHGAFTVRNVRIRNDTSRPTAVVDSVSPSNDTGHFENIHVTGTGDGPLKASSGATAKIVDSCVESSFQIQNFDDIQNVTTSNCKEPTSPTDAPHNH